MQIAAARQLIERRYADVHGAKPGTDYRHYCVVGERQGEPSAVLGFRLASSEPLFLETYLDAPIESVVSEALQTPFTREQIVEIGAHASERSRATIALWAQTARHLSDVATVAVAVLTDPLRSMFARLGIPIHELCDADPGKLDGEEVNWGRYYDQKPRICAGLIAPALTRLSSLDTRMTGVCR